MKENIIKKVLSTKKASQSLLTLSQKDRRDILFDVASSIKQNKNKIIEANKKDIQSAIENNFNENFIERLSLDELTIESIYDSVRQIAEGEDDLFKTISKVTQDSGITIQKKIFPLGVVAVIYESRPNVTVDAFAIAFKSGNAIILKGGKEIINTNHIFVTIIKKVLRKYGINEHIIQDFSGMSRDDMNMLIQNDNIDCLIPRGGRGLIDYIRNNAKIPVIITGASVVHAYIDKDADFKKAVDVVINSKMRRTSICNALDVVLVHKNISKDFFSLFVEIIGDLDTLEIRADKDALQILQSLKYKKIKAITDDDYDTEFLDMIVAVRTVDSGDDAIRHIQKHSLGHSEVIITENNDTAQEFFQKIDSACLYLNTSTQFSDGGEFGMGGEIGISTQKLHARGPFSYKELTTYKYIIKSDGVVRT